MRRVTRNWQLYLFLLPAVAVFLVFNYYPMYGVQIAFRDFRANLGITGSPWVGLKHFERFVSTSSFSLLLTNTLRISLMTLFLGFPIPILFALLVNEIRFPKYRKLIQTVSYAPHFISTVVMVSMLIIFLDKDYGIVNKAIGWFGLGPYDFMTKGSWFASIYVLSNIWQNMGWDAILYIAALSSVDMELHEAAMIDGASRLKRIIHINIPSILPTITIMLILACGKVMSVGFEKVFLMQNPLNTSHSEIISTFVYKAGLQSAQYSFSTAIGLFNSVVNLVLLLSVNALAKKLGETSLW
ncbi:MAG TPA: sugar ABC transporter permease [Candidatus Limiplasma stercoravium]|nr:sugar ABC transporter permease [Candidatus Limiplasma stercoravium]